MISSKSYVASRSFPTKILHIEDDDLYASLVQHMLTEDNGSSAYDITHVETLKAALHELKNQEFEAILLDLGLCDVSGLDNLRAIRSERPDLPVIVITGHDNAQIASRAQAAGAHSYIAKGKASQSVLRSAIESSLLAKAT